MMNRGFCLLVEWLWYTEKHSCAVQHNVDMLAVAPPVQDTVALVEQRLRAALGIPQLKLYWSHLQKMRLLGWPCGQER